MDIFVKFHHFVQIVLKILQFLTISLHCTFLRNNDSTKLLQLLVILTNASRYLLVGCFRFIQLIDLLVAFFFLLSYFLNGLPQMLVFIKNFLERSLGRLITIGVLDVAVGIFSVEDSSVL